MKSITCPLCRNQMLPVRAVWQCSNSGCTAQLQGTLEAGALPTDEDGPLLTEGELDLALALFSHPDRGVLAAFAGLSLNTYARLANALRRKLRGYRELLIRQSLGVPDEDTCQAERQRITALLANGKITSLEAQGLLDDVAAREGMSAP